jgi:RNA polymerase sigma factor (sigma-70 family)
MKGPKSDIRELWETMKQDLGTSALRSLMEGTYPLLFGYGLKFSKDKEFVQDCIQDVFITIWQHRKTLAVPESPKGYLLASLRRKMINNHLKGTWIPIDSLYDSDIPQEHSLDQLVFGHEEVEFQSKFLQNLLSQLSDRQREVIYLRFYQNLSRAEVSSAMGISEQSVSNTLQKALLALRKAWPIDHVFLFATLLPELLSAVN